MSEETPVVHFKSVAYLPVSNELLIDAGLMEPPPMTSEQARWWKWYRRKQAIGYAVAAPLDWLAHGSGWLHVETINMVWRLLRLNSRVVHESPSEDND